MITRKQLKQEAKKALKGNWGLGVVITLFMLVAGYAWQILPPYGIDAPQSTWKSVASPLWIFFVLSALSIGVTKTYLKLNRFQETKFTNIFFFFTNGKQYLRAVGSYFFTTLYTILWTLLLIIPGIIKSYSYAMTYYIISDEPELSIHQAITKSRKLMNGHKWDFFVLQLSFLGWVILSLLTLGIGLLWVIPYFSSTSAQFYLKLREAEQTAPAQSE